MSSSACCLPEFIQLGNLFFDRFGRQGDKIHFRAVYDQPLTDHTQLGQPIFFIFLGVRFLPVTLLRPSEMPNVHCTTYLAYHKPKTTAPSRDNSDVPTHTKKLFDTK